MKKNIAFDIVAKHINKWDAWGLLSGGAPLDEYDIETQRIVNALPLIKSQMSLANTIKEVFDKAFGEEHNLENCIKVAENIWDELMSEEDSTFFK
ncbi:YugE family protein [Bacillus timonensis]|nr:YugE family protein [Bacillus timonensis]